ncbi:hypothetical protein D3C72_1166250 [compost metagenome]
MAGDERWRRFDGPVAARRMQIRVANAARFRLDEDLAGTGHRHGHLAQHQRLAQLLDNGGFHGSGCHGIPYEVGRA